MGTTVSPQYGRLHFKKEKQNDKTEYLGILSIWHNPWIKAQEFENEGLCIYDKLQISESKAGIRLSGLYMSMSRQIHLRCQISFPIYTAEPSGKILLQLFKILGIQLWKVFSNEVPPLGTLFWRWVQMRMGYSNQNTQLLPSNTPEQ